VSSFIFYFLFFPLSKKKFEVIILLSSLYFLFVIIRPYFVGGKRKNLSIAFY